MTKRTWKINLFRFRPSAKLEPTLWFYEKGQVTNGFTPKDGDWGQPSILAILIDELAIEEGA